MNFETLRLTREGEVATLTIVSKKGSMGPTFWPELQRATAALGDARVLILRGQELFSAGLDVKASAAGLGEALGNRDLFRAQVAPMHAAFEGVAALPIPVIAAVHAGASGRARNSSVPQTSACAARTPASACRKCASGSPPTWAACSACPASSARAGRGNSR